MIAPTPVWKVDTLLGEGPAWFADDGMLRFVDIKKGLVHCYAPATGDRDTLNVGGSPSFILPEHGGGLLVGSRDSVHRLEGARLGEVVATLSMPSHNRMNDATVDHLGRIWFGTMDDGETQATGALHCLSPSGLRHMGGDAVVTNGPAVTPDCKWLYHVDSGNRRIWRFRLAEGPGIVGRELFLQLGEDDGFPDGVVLDSEGCLWVALWDGWGVRRYSPEGELLLHVAFPCARVTKIAFGGADLRTAFVTTARTGLDDAARGAQPLAGSLFSFPAPVAGMQLPAARLKPC